MIMCFRLWLGFFRQIADVSSLHCKSMMRVFALWQLHHGTGFTIAMLVMDFFKISYISRTTRKHA